MSTENTNAFWGERARESEKQNAERVIREKLTETEYHIAMHDLSMLCPYFMIMGYVPLILAEMAFSPLKAVIQQNAVITPRTCIIVGSAASIVLLFREMRSDANRSRRNRFIGVFAVPLILAWIPNAAFLSVLHGICLTLGMLALLEGFHRFGGLMSASVELDCTQKELRRALEAAERGEYVDLSEIRELYQQSSRSEKEEKKDD
jgi:hypothetical protein